MNDSYATGNLKRRYHVDGRWVPTVYSFVNYRGVLSDIYASGKVKGIDIVGEGLLASETVILTAVTYRDCLLQIAMAVA